MSEPKPNPDTEPVPDQDPPKELHYEVIEINESNFDSIKSKLQKLAEDAIQSTKGDVITTRKGKIIRLPEGDDFIQKVINRWETGEHRFSGQGDKLWTLSAGDELIAIGGLNREKDPVFKDDLVGRARHMYVAKEYRGRHLSNVLMNLIEGKARENGWHTLTLHSSERPEANALYAKHGFQWYEGPTTTDITHIKRLEEMPGK